MDKEPRRVRGSRLLVALAGGMVLFALGAPGGWLEDARTTTRIEGAAVVEAKGAGDGTFRPWEGQETVPAGSVLWIGPGAEGAVGRRPWLHGAWGEASPQPETLLGFPAIAGAAPRVLQGALGAASKVINRFPELPDRARADRKILPGAIENAKYSPQPGLVILSRRDTEVPVQFRWTEKRSGYLVAADAKLDQVRYVRVLEDRFASLKLPQGRVYYWQLVDDEKRVLIGPYRFDLERLGEEAVAPRLARLRELRRPIEVRW